MAAGVRRLVNQNRTTPRAEDVDGGREKAPAEAAALPSTCERLPLTAPAHRTTQHARLDTGTSVRECALLTGARPLAAGSPQRPRIACNPVAPTPSPSCASSTRAFVRLACQGDDNSDVLCANILLAEHPVCLAVSHRSGWITWRHSAPSSSIGRVLYRKIAGKGFACPLRLPICRLHSVRGTTGAKGPLRGQSGRSNLVLQTQPPPEPIPSPHQADVASLLSRSSASTNTA